MITCPRCNGLGTVPPLPDNTPGAVPPEPTKCGYCDGIGKVPTREVMTECDARWATALSDRTQTKVRASPDPYMYLLEPGTALSRHGRARTWLMVIAV
jgi:hypothetical protein